MRWSNSKLGSEMMKIIDEREIPLHQKKKKKVNKDIKEQTGEMRCS